MDREYYADKIKEIIKQAREDNVIIGYYAVKDASTGIVVFDANQNDIENMEMTLIPLS